MAHDLPLAEKQAEKPRELAKLQSDAARDRFSKELMLALLTSGNKTQCDQATRPEQTTTQESGVFPHLKIFTGKIGECGDLSGTHPVEHQLSPDSKVEVAVDAKNDFKYTFGFDHDSFDSVTTKQQDFTENTMWDKTKRFFGHEDTLADRVRSKVLRGITPDERAKLEAKDTAPPGSLLPSGFSADGLRAKVDAEKEKIASQVRADMPETERSVLDKQVDDYQAAQARAYEHWARGGRFILVEPGPAVKAFWDKVREKTEEYAEF
jgi:hypothetical protein